MTLQPAIAIIDPEAAAAAEGAAQGDCPKHPGHSGLRRGCRKCVAEELAAAKAAEIAAARERRHLEPPRDIRRTRWRTAGTVLDVVLTLALLGNLAAHWRSCRAAQPPAPAAAGPESQAAAP